MHRSGAPATVKRVKQQLMEQCARAYPLMRDVHADGVIRYFFHVGRALLSGLEGINRSMIGDSGEGHLCFEKTVETARKPHEPGKLEACVRNCSNRL